MNLSQLRFVTAVAETASFSRAADLCCVTQPTLSNAIAQLEEELGERLFVRTTRKVALTDFGRHLLPGILEVLSSHDALLRKTREFLYPERRLIRVGTSPLISPRLLGLIIDPFRRQNPEVEVILREMNMADLYRLLEEGQLDFIFGVSGTHKGQWKTAFLYREPLLFLPSKAGAASRQRMKTVLLKDIADETFVMVPDACGLARATRSLFRSHRLKLNEYPGEALSYQVLEEWALMGVGAAILPKSKISRKNRSAFPLVEKSGDPVTLSFEAVWIGTEDTAPHLADFARHLQQVAPTPQ